MTLKDIIYFSSQALLGFRLRTLMMLLAMTIGIASVILLTTLGESARQYIMSQFSSLGSNLIIVIPGRSETKGALPPLFGETPRDLTLQDALALYRSHSVKYIAPIVVGNAPVSYQQREREITIAGSTSELLNIRQLEMSKGRFLPDADPTRSAAICVIGKKVEQELFGSQSALNQWLRIHDRRFRVIGVLSEKGQSIGTDFRDIVIVPIADAQTIFNTESLYRILVQAKYRDLIPVAKRAVNDIIRKRHNGEEDVTVITQDAVLATFDKIFITLTLTVGGIAAISLIVAGILIMNVMLIAVSQRTAEIGLLKALGLSSQRVQMLFLSEATLLSCAGAACGLLLSLIILYIMQQFFPDFPIALPLWGLLVAIIIPLLTGLVFGVLPARRAARLDPVQALSQR